MKIVSVRLAMVCICLLVVVQISINGSYANVDPNSIVGLWLLDEGSGDVVNDISGNGNDGTVVDANWVDGVSGTALEFDGASHVEIPASETTDDYVDGFTYLLWVQPTGAPPNDNTRVIERDWHNPTIQIGPADFYGSIEINGDQASSHVRGGTWSMNEWSFVALTWDGSTLSLYVDEEMVNDIGLGAPDFTKANNEGAIWLAQWKGGAGWDFTGVIDEVGVFNAALSQDDINSIRENGLDSLASVSSAGKMAMTWGYVKSIR
jgi:hypothetical protein